MPNDACARGSALPKAWVGASPSALLPSSSTATPLDARLLPAASPSPLLPPRFSIVPFCLAEIASQSLEFSPLAPSRGSGRVDEPADRRSNPRKRRDAPASTRRRRWRRWRRSARVSTSTTLTPACHHADACTSHASGSSPRVFRRAIIALPFAVTFHQSPPLLLGCLGCARVRLARASAFRNSARSSRDARGSFRAVDFPAAVRFIVAASDGQRPPCICVRS